ncbi:hypothetical protein [Burkholderia ubonensis]|uniref:hypothetical protein n=1 Tax=Burkholderia ubonensis TaxID=101571 RepID=UPI000A9926DD|nr:hypothetical protein [Burkholderia ubonensis]
MKVHELIALLQSEDQFAEVEFANPRNNRETWLVGGVRGTGESNPHVPVDVVMLSQD